MIFKFLVTCLQNNTKKGTDFSIPNILILRSFYPNATSRIIIIINPNANPSVPKLECLPT